MEIDDLFQKYMIQDRAEVQQRMWPVIKAILLKSPTEFLMKLAIDLEADPSIKNTLYWPLETMKMIFEEEHVTILKDLLPHSAETLKTIILTLL